MTWRSNREKLAELGSRYAMLAEGTLVDWKTARKPALVKSLLDAAHVFWCGKLEILNPVHNAKDVVRRLPHRVTAFEYRSPDQAVEATEATGANVVLCRLTEDAVEWWWWIQVGVRWACHIEGMIFRDGSNRAFALQPGRGTEREFRELSLMIFQTIGNFVQRIEAVAAAVPRISGALRSNGKGGPQAPAVPLGDAFNLIDLTQPTRRVVAEEGGSRRQVREHEVRGHPRRLRDGRVIFIPPFTRGNPAIGRVKKAYLAAGDAA